MSSTATSIGDIRCRRVPGIVGAACRSYLHEET
uniref:Uncharacterized protein n=1 Tax=Anguilla anguilla TaxID=7936 RepID=A0A0E9SUI2_ANGAN